MKAGEPLSQNEGVIGLYANRTYLAPACSCGRSVYDFNLAKRVASTLRHAKDTAALAPVDQMCKHCGEILTPIPADKLPQGVTPDVAGSPRRVSRDASI